MALIDERGRLFGKVNLIDAGVGLVLLVLIALAYAGYALFHLPAPPTITAVEPAQVTAGPDSRVVLRGENFLPFLRVFIQRSGQPAALSHRLDPDARKDAYTLVNSTQGQFLVESPTLAEVKVPEGTLPGTYDLVLYNETQQVALRERAFTIVAAPAPPAPTPAPPALLRALGAFTGLDRSEAKQFIVGLRFPAKAQTLWAELIAVEPLRADVVRLRAGDSPVDASVEGKVQVPATLRIRCVVVGTECRAGGTLVTPRAYLPIPLGDRTVNFFVEAMTPDLPEESTTAEILVRFVVHPEVASLVKVGDVDRRMATLARPRDGAVLGAIRNRQEVTSRTNLNLSDLGQQTFGMDERVVMFEADVRMPMLASPGGWVYRNLPIKAGGYLTFETSSYTMRGWILRVTVPEAARKAAGGAF